MKIISCTFEKTYSNGPTGCSSSGHSLRVERLHGYNVSMTIKFENDMVNGFKCTGDKVYISTMTMSPTFSAQSQEAMEFLRSHKNDCEGVSNFLALVDGNNNESDVNVDQGMFESKQERLQERLQREQEKREREQEKLQERLQREQEKRQREQEKLQERLQRAQEKIQYQQENSYKNPGFFQNTQKVDLSKWVVSQLCPSGGELKLMICTVNSTINSNQYFKCGQLHINTDKSTLIYHNVTAQIENGVQTCSYEKCTEQEKSNNIVISNVRTSLF